MRLVRNTPSSVFAHTRPARQFHRRGIVYFPRRHHHDCIEESLAGRAFWWCKQKRVGATGQEHKKYVARREADISVTQRLGILLPCTI